MLYLLRNKDGSTDRYSSGTFIYPGGESRHLKDDFRVNVLSYYKSGRTGEISQSGDKDPSENSR
jgi:hypothetical protein